MTLLLRYLSIIILLSGIAGCSQFIYRPHSRQQQQRAKPPVSLLEEILVYRQLYGNWPASREQFVARDARFEAAFRGFPYRDVRFRARSRAELLFSFSGHIRDEQAYQQTGLIDLNGYGGTVRFYRDKGRWIWKIKMN
ncbi:hypothetical protein SAMN05444008_1237 [Cnuella takakiae]|uniref:Uncharacterized protein n=1 Tax=Cnuella takakiae TaxID=1302690 RepID=A0A1M5ICF0_9BACT|nr:hypothetical protein [Cnuella takakiae]OLY90779.1 hypothetical protein BUE76_01845 [Cnuella takakiae]SHG25443.1 hypothetical protein SAMN05444008_1237 [Cnuella takakiae]